MGFAIWNCASAAPWNGRKWPRTQFSSSGKVSSVIRRRLLITE